MITFHEKMPITHGGKCFKTLFMSPNVHNYQKLFFIVPKNSVVEINVLNQFVPVGKYNIL